MKHWIDIIIKNVLSKKYTVDEYVKIRKTFMSIEESDLCIYQKEIIELNIK